MSLIPDHVHSMTGYKSESYTNYSKISVESAVGKANSKGRREICSISTGCSTLDCEVKAGYVLMFYAGSTNSK